MTCRHWIFSLATLLLMPIRTEAVTLPDFKATFDVKVLGFTVGQAHQQMQCHQAHCVLKSEAKPPKWARRFINESAVETVHLQQSDTEFKWMEYKKFLTRHYDDKTVQKTFTLVRNEAEDYIEFVETNRTWPMQKDVYDVISMAYAIQFKVLNQQPLDTLYLQDDKIQERFKFTQQNRKDEIDLDFEDEVQTRLFAFHNGKIDAKLWLMPDLNYFPVRIIILNKSEDRKIELELNRKPKIK